MANSPQAKKRARQIMTRRGRNVHLRSTFRTHIKKVLQAIKQGDKTSAEAAYKEAIPVFDRMATKHIIHKNKAARYKSRLNTRIKALKTAKAA